MGREDREAGYRENMGRGYKGRERGKSGRGINLRYNP